MTVAQITERQATEAEVFELAKQLGALLDEAERIELPDGRSAAEEAPELARED